MRAPELRFPVVAETAGVALHLTQRSRGRFACFARAADRLTYLDYAARAAEESGCVIHAYALLDNHAHLLLTPSHDGAASRLARGLSARFARHLGEDGVEAALDAAHHLQPVRSKSHLLRAMRYIEENPVRAKLARRPEDWPWSSYRANALGEFDALVTPHPLYYALGRSAGERQRAYRRRFAERERKIS